ncbi:hypothetical protein TNCV_2771711 [Trichonephila clavipes]|nr:hypothetical protein TNCV_2771711 [Trichonephila clavipes]
MSQLTTNEMMDAQTELVEQNAYMWPGRVFGAKEYTELPLILVPKNPKGHVNEKTREPVTNSLVTRRIIGPILILICVSSVSKRLITSSNKATKEVWANNIVILNHGQMLRTAPEQTPLPTELPQHTIGRTLTLDRINVHQTRHGGSSEWHEGSMNAASVKSSRFTWFTDQTHTIYPYS